MQLSIHFQWKKPARFLGAVVLTLFLTGNLQSIAGAADKPGNDKSASEKTISDKPSPAKSSSDKPSPAKSDKEEAVSDEVKKRTESTQDKLSNSEKMLKNTMSNFGVEDEAVQDIIIAHVKEEVWAHARIREQVSRLYRALRNKRTSENTLKSLTEELYKVIADDQERRREANKQLDRKVKYSESPRMEAMLLMFGIIGDGPMMTDISPSRRPNR